MYKVNYHIHTNFSDGKSTPEEYIDVALRKNFNEMGFSDHLIILSENKTSSNSMKIKDVKNYVGRIESLKEEFKGRIKIKLGIEVDYFLAEEKVIATILNKFNFDYVLGSVHRIGNLRIDDESKLHLWKNMNQDHLYKVYKKYFNLIQKAASSQLFDIIAHPDFVKVFNFKPKKDIRQLYIETTEKISDNDLCAEINSAGLRKPVNEIFPDKEFLRLCYEKDIPITIGNDAHNSKLTSSHLTDLINYIKAGGYRKIAVFDNRHRIFIEI